MSSKSTELKSSDHGFNSILARFEPVIGLEVHCQLKTESKLFCGCKTTFGALANQNTCPVCLGLPGVLPVLNHEAVEYAIRMALAVGATIRERSVFARKQYFYPDLPKGYQLTQYDLPYCQHGTLLLDNGRRIRIERIHMEEDAGKNIHGDNASYVDLNRAGIPLLEIVSAPDLSGPAEAAEYLKKLRAIARYLDISDGNLEEGSFRCDANVSLRPVGSKTLGTRTEIKNLNSFRNVEKAITYEILRQADVLESGDKVKQVTLQFDAAVGRTIVMRSKEDSPDYRYFPDPDLGVLHISEARIQSVRANTRELPEQKVQRFQEAFSIPEADARQLTEEKELAAFFEDVVKKVAGSVAPKIVANWMLSEYLREFNARQWQFEKPFVSSEHFAKLLKLLGEGTISGKIAKTVFEEMAATGADPDGIIAAKGLVQINDSAAIKAVVDQVIAAHPEQVAQYLSGKQKVYGFLVGQVMKISAGRFNPNLLNECLKEALHGKS
ncbi:MAG TPA: Asp-tRNA(Asn)/Glu-tRNA(Gln) amidotransferase subunit GatB [Oligoflexus sp.]|uniref:Asp-tRNA(Asn)/Glu-tRNA(Gln) amidotransferase subunit GatB n=1 Tax=Oligoflexus sp. TaxID=1971216 RepID=UPI002D705B86|nr:Asp-tRNA(Asn)/Glu-tRNA(Gln) amidotransferase subunit GatB [Oligoflexus sp.]HYX34329.1 Asp-tRNA(Asn)/Glu-tRNA(Gln) amidotransferase subunit GatB [Oligoflexus sp.]